MRYLQTRHPVLYEINSRVWLRELSQAAGRPLTLAEVPDTALEELSRRGIDLVWLMGVFTTGEEGRRISLALDGLRADYDHALPGWRDEDVIGSPYAVASYEVSPSLGGRTALAALRARLAERGIGLLLDFVPNHTARDHAWVYSKPEFYLQGTPRDAHDPNFFTAKTMHGERVLACGRDPYFPGWTDTAQLNYRHQEARRALTRVLVELSAQCDGLRCDMAMLILEEIFDRTWGSRADVPEEARAHGEFWAEAIDAVRKVRPGFLFLAEAYWDLEWRLMSLGFDYAYDKVLLDRLKTSDGAHIRGHLQADLEYQERLARFLENHDEKRAASIFHREKHQAAAVIAMTSPGLRFFHEGQAEGHTVHMPVQLGRRQQPPADAALSAFYDKLFAALQLPALRTGRPRLLHPQAPWPGDYSHQSVIAWRWDGGPEHQLVSVVNFSDRPAKARLPLELRAVEGRRIVLQDLLSTARYDYDGTEAVRPGIGLELAPWRAALFSLSRYF